MHGPIAAAMRSTLAPSEIIAAIAWSVTPASRPAPAGMGRADHARLAVGQQHRRAIGGDDAEQQAGPVGDQRVGLRPLGMRHGFA